MNRRSGKESRSRILKAAMQVFSDAGYAGASMRAIAKEAKISTGGVYLYFRSKEDLYLSLFREGIREKVSTSKQIVASADSPTEALHELLRFHVEYAKKHREMILMHLKERGFNYGLDIKKRYFKGQMRLIEDVIREGIRKGEFRECDAGCIASYIMALLRGLMITMATERGGGASPDELMNFVLRGILSGESPEDHVSAAGIV